MLLIWLKVLQFQWVWKLKLNEKTKNNKKLLEAIDATKIYEPIDAIKILKENKYAKFNETLEVAINLGIDPNKTDQGIRGVINLPKGTGKKY